MSDDDAELEKVWKSEYSLKDIVDPKNFKSYDQLKARLNDVMGLGDRPAAAPVAAKAVVEEEAPWQEDKPVAKKAAKAPVVEDDDEDLAMFRELADLDD